MPKLISSSQTNEGITQKFDDGTEKFIPIKTAPPKPKPTNLDFNVSDSSDKNIVSDSGEVQDQLADFTNATDQLKNTLNDNSIIDNALSIKPYSQTTEGSQELDDIRNSLKNIGVFTGDELSQIADAGSAAGYEFDPLIREAQEAKRMGLPKALVGAGEVGGFMNTQFAGIAALASTQGEDFFGAGGELERIKSVYDENILNLKAKKQQAILEAEAAARKAIRTNKREDVQFAMDAFNLAKSAHDEAITLANEKLGIIEKLNEVKRNMVRFEREKKEWGIADEDRELEKKKADELNAKLFNDYQNELSLNGYQKLSPSEVARGTKYDENDIVRIQNPLTGVEDIWRKPPAGDTLVQKWLEAYPDSGITLKDDLATAREKLVNNSKIFRNENKLDSNSGGGGGNENYYKFTNLQKQKIADAKLTDADPEIQNAFLQLPKSYQDEYKRAFDKESKNKSVESERFFEQWAMDKAEEVENEIARKEKLDAIKDVANLSNKELSAMLNEYADENGNLNSDDIPAKLLNEAEKRDLFE